MKYIFIVLLFASPLVVSADIYKCKQVDGKIGFSDKPCPKTSSEEKITYKRPGQDWVSHLRKEISSSIKITEVIRKNGEVTIRYAFETKSDSNNFVKLANNVSSMPVVLMKYLEPKGNDLGQAEIIASNKPNPLLDKLKHAKKIEQTITRPLNSFRPQKVRPTPD